MLPAEETVLELTQLVWTTVLGLEAEARPEGDSPPELTMSVDISGSWDGTVSLSFPKGLARRLAAAMLACAEQDASASEVQDVVGELVNMVGGNVKGMMPGPSKLSVPRIESPDAVRREDGKTHWFVCDGQSFSVTVYEGLRSQES